MEKEITFTFDFSIFTNVQYNVDSITKTLEIEPTSKWLKGDIVKENLFRKESCWSIISEEKKALVFEDAFIDFFDKFLLKEKKLRSLIIENNLKAQIDIVVKIYKGNTMPGIHLNRQVLKSLSNLECSIDFDIYDFR